MIKLELRAPLTIQISSTSLGRTGFGKLLKKS